MCFHLLCNLLSLYEFLNLMKKILILCAGVALFTACKKDDEAKSRRDYLTAGKWYPVSTYTYTKITDANGQIIDQEDTTEAVEPCVADGYILFNGDGSFNSDEGPTKCDPSASQTSNGRWVLLENDTKLNVNVDNSLQAFRINELNGSSFVIAYDSTYTFLDYSYEMKYEIKLKR